MKLQIIYPRKELNSIGKQRFQGKNIPYFEEKPIVSVSNHTYNPTGDGILTSLMLILAMLEENKLTY